MSIFDKLEAEWHDATDWFQDRHQPHPYDEHQQHSHQEEHMPLAETAAGIQDRAAAIQAGLQNSATALHDVLDNHVAQLISTHLPELAAIVDTVSNTPVIKAALGAAHVPDGLLGPVAAMLDALAAAHPRPAEPVPA